MRIIIFLLLISFIIQPAFSQAPSKKEMQEQMQQMTKGMNSKVADLEKQIAAAKKNKEDAETIKGLEDQLAMLKQQLSLIGNITKTVSTIPTKNLETALNNDDTYDKPVFPKMNAALLASIPKISSPAALTNYVSDLHNHFLKKVNPDLIVSFKQIAGQLEYDGEKLQAAAIMAWYSQAPSQSILLITKAASQAKASDLTMNNLAAILNMGGLEQKSIPILNYLVNQYPQNAMILNNLGQAYAGLGDLNTAMMSFGRCLQIEPNHPQANNTAGQIELSRGNTAAATQHFKNSLNGAFTEEADRQVRFVEPDMDIDDYIKHNIHIPEYFNEDKYNVPRQCQNVSEAEELWAVYKGYDDMITAVSQKYKAIVDVSIEKTSQFYKKKTADVLALKKVDQPPFLKKAILAWDAMLKKYNSDADWLVNMDRDYEKRKTEIFESYQARTPGSDCAAQTASINQYLRETADITKAWQLKNTAFNKKYINQFIYWSFLMSYTSDEFKAHFYNWVGNYLSLMRSIARTVLWGPPCQQMQQRTTPAEEIVIEEPNCPIDIEIKLIVGKIALNCKRFSFGGGEIVKFKYEKNFTSKQSTLSLGIGATFELGSRNFGGGFNGSASIDVGESVFITLDGNNSFSDFGMNARASASISLSRESSMSTGNEIVREVSRTTEIIGGEAGVGCSAGINSGLSVTGGASLNPGPLKAIF